MTSVPEDEQYAVFPDCDALSSNTNGQKFLYHTKVDDKLHLANSPDRLIRQSGVGRKISPLGLSLFFTLGFVPAPYCIYEAIRKFEVSVAYSSGSNTDLDKAAVKLEDLLQRALASEVEQLDRYAVLASGGMDSSLVVSLLEDLFQAPVSTLSVHTRDLCDPLSTSRPMHRNLLLNSSNWSDLLPLFAGLDEPVADSMLIPLHAAFQAMRPGATAISGIGADDWFGGLYEHLALHIWSSCEAVPASWPEKDRWIVKRMITDLASRGNASAGWIRMVSRMGADERSALLGSYLHDRATSDESDEFLRCWIERAPSFLDGAMRFAQRVRLPGQTLALLRTANRLTNTRHFSPFLAKDTASFAAGLPVDMMVRNSHRKVLLRAIANRRLTPGILEQPKVGFSIPLPGLIAPLIRNWEVIEDDPALNQRAVRRLIGAWTNSDGQEQLRLAAHIWMVAVWRLWWQTHRAEL